MDESDLRFRLWCVAGMVLSVIGMLAVFVLSYDVSSLPVLMQVHLTLSGFLFAGLFMLCFVLIATLPEPVPEFNPNPDSNRD